MRKRFSRRAAVRLKRRIFVVTGVLLTVFIICLFVTGGFSENVSENNSSDMNYGQLSNVCNEVYMDLKREEWDPLSDEALEAASTDQSEKKEKKENSDKKETGSKPYPENWNESDETEIIRTTLVDIQEINFLLLKMVVR